MNIIIKTTFLLLSATATCSVSAQRLTLSQCQTLATEHNLTLRSAEAQVERARIMHGTAWDLDKTDIALSQDPTSGGSPDNAISISQSIEFPTVYTARRRQLRAETKAEESRRRIVATQINADIASAYWQLVYENEKLNILRSQDSLLVSYAKIARQRYDAGEARQLESLSADRLLEENAMEIAATQGQIRSAQLTLRTLVGNDSVITPADERLVPIAYTPSAVYNYSSTAEGEYANDRIVVAEKALSVAKNAYAPSLSLTLKNQLVITGWDPYHENRSRYEGGNFMGFEVGVGVPLFYGATKAKVKVARKDREIAEMELHREQNQLQNEYSNAQSVYNNALHRVRYYEDKGMKTAESTARLGALEYENGEISYVEYVNALQESITLRLKRAAVVNEYNQAVVALQRLSGEF